MEGFRVHQWGDEPLWEDIPDPQPGPGELLVDVEACSVGLTVLNCINGDLSNEPGLLPRVPGHEAIGTVVDVGVGVDPGFGGSRIAAYFYLSCGQCHACRVGHDPRCSELAGWVGVHRDGGYARRMVLPAHNAVVLPAGLGPVDATVVPDAVATPVHVARRADIGPDDRVVVFGAGGGVGIHMVQVARHAGASVAGLDIVDAKLAELDRLGVLALRSDDLSGLDPEMIFPDGPPTVVIDLLGTTASARWSVDGLAMGGRLVNLTTFRDRPFPIESRELVFRELTLVGSRYANRSELLTAAELVAAGAVKPIIGETVGPDDLLDLHRRLAAGELLGRGALDWSAA